MLTPAKTRTHSRDRMARIRHDIDNRLAHIELETGLPKGLWFVAYPEWSFDQKLTILRVDMRATAPDGQEVATSQIWGAVALIDRDVTESHTSLAVAALQAAIEVLV